MVEFSPIYFAVEPGSSLIEPRSRRNVDNACYSSITPSEDSEKAIGTGNPPLGRIAESQKKRMEYARGIQERRCRRGGWSRMSFRNGDKSRENRLRRAKIAQRAKTKQLRESLAKAAKGKK